MPSDTQNWRTPPQLVHRLEERFALKFALDAAATAENTVVPGAFYTTQNDGLSCPWVDVTFCNPPFQNFGLWIAKAWAAFVEQSVRSVVIGPAGCSQDWFQTYAGACSCILAPSKRLQFLHPDGKPSKAARADTMIYCFISKRPSFDPGYRLFSFNMEPGYRLFSINMEKE